MIQMPTEVLDMHEALRYHARDVLRMTFFVGLINWALTVLVLSMRHFVTDVTTQMYCKEWVTKMMECN